MPTATLTQLADLMALAKPRLSTLVMLSAGAGLYVAPGKLGGVRALVTLVCTAFVVGAANALNSYLERDVDALMRRTRARPLPAQRLRPRSALLFALALMVVGLPGLAAAANLLTAGLGLAAFLLYVLAYTPLKRYSAWALVVGAVPGAMPPLMGWTAVTGQLDLGGLALFALLFVWQLPHFTAISIYLREEYQHAGLHVFAGVYGERTARAAISAYSLFLVPVSLLLVPLGVATPIYGGVAAAAGVLLWLGSLSGLKREVAPGWAKRVFAGTLAYLTVVLVTLVVAAP